MHASCNLIKNQSLHVPRFVIFIIIRKKQIEAGVRK